MKPEHEKYWQEAQSELDQWLGLPSTPKTLEQGQLWTLFPVERSDHFEDEGVIVLIQKVLDEQFRVIPVGTDPNIRTFLEPVISGMSLETSDPDAVIVPALLCLSCLTRNAFETARYMGRVKPAGMGILNEMLLKFDRIQEKKKQIAARDNNDLNEKEMEQAVADGVFLDLPMGDVQLWDKRNEVMMKVLNSWIQKSMVCGSESNVPTTSLPEKTLSFHDFKSRRPTLFQAREETLAAAPLGLMTVMDVFKGQSQTYSKLVALVSGTHDLEVFVQGREVQLILHEKESVEPPEMMYVGPDQKLQQIEFRLEPGLHQWVSLKKLMIPVKLKAGQEWISIVP